MPTILLPSPRRSGEKDAGRLLVLPVVRVCVCVSQASFRSTEAYLVISMMKQPGHGCYLVCACLQPLYLLSNQILSAKS